MSGGTWTSSAASAPYPPDPDLTGAKMIWFSLTLVLLILAYVAQGMVRRGLSFERLRWLYLFGVVLFAGALANFAIFWHIGVAIGGDALSGKAADGHYYVSSHGRFTEVPEWLYRYSRAHTVSTWVTYPLAVVGWLLMYRVKQLEKRASKPTLSDLDV
jgi:hypothetical protein